MKKYLLDTNTVSSLYSPDDPLGENIRSALKESVEVDDEIYVSILTIYELEYGYSNADDSQKPLLKKKISDISSDFEILSLSKKGASIFGELKSAFKSLRNLSKRSILRHNLDLMLAGTAITENCILVSADALYSDLMSLNSDLLIDDWTQSIE